VAPSYMANIDFSSNMFILQATGTSRTAWQQIDAPEHCKSRDDKCLTNYHQALLSVKVNLFLYLIYWGLEVI
jgi:hypothetical protein